MGRKGSLFFFFPPLIFPPPGSEAKQKHFAFERLFALAFSSLCFRAQLSSVPKWCSCAMKGESQGRARLSQVTHWGLGHYRKGMGTTRGGPQRGDPDRSHVLVGQPGEGTGCVSSLLFLLIHPAACSVCYRCAVRGKSKALKQKKSGYAQLHLWICFDGCSPSPPVDAEILLPVAALQGTERCWGQLRARWNCSTSRVRAAAVGPVCRTLRAAFSGGSSKQVPGYARCFLCSIDKCCP